MVHLSGQVTKEEEFNRWISPDPALEEYLPKAPVNEEARKYNANLPGEGGVFSPVNMSLYHFAANNPVNYVDPDGRDDLTNVLNNLEKGQVSKLEYFGHSNKNNLLIQMKTKKQLYRVIFKMKRSPFVIKQ